MRILKNILLVLSTGYVFVYFSEHLFWARIRPDDSLGGWVATWLVYSLVAFLFLAIIERFNIRSIWPLFLAGAMVGWLTEGVIVQTAYESLPLSISFTGLAWHALITVWVGWYALRRSLLSTSAFSTLKLSMVLGCCYGLWAISWWMEPDGGVASPTEFAVFSLLATCLVMIAYWISNWSATEPFRPNRWVILIVSGVFVIYFLFVAVPTVPVALVIMPFLLGCIYLGLSRSFRADSRGSFVSELVGHVPVWKYLGILILPLSAIFVYSIAFSLQLRWQTNWFFYLVTTPLGFIFFGLALYQSWRTPSAS